MNIPITNNLFQESPVDADDAKRMLTAGSRILANEGVFDAFGHMSIRDPEHPETFFMSRSISPELMLQEDIIELDQQGNVIYSPDPSFRPFGERFIHAAIYAVRPDVNCICHPHPMELIPFASTDIPLRSIYHQDVTFYDGIPVFRDLPDSSGCLINTLEMGKALAVRLGMHRGLLIQNHGAVVVGESVARTVYSCITMRDNARMLLQTMAMSPEKIYYISTEAAKAGMEKQFTYGLARSWKYWCSHAKEAFPDIAEILF